MLKIWGRRNAFNVQKVLWLAAELNLDYQHIAAGGSFGGLDTTEFLALNPHGRIPVIEENGLVVWESHAILRYLAARHGTGAFWSEDPGIRSYSDRWMDWSLATVQPDFLNGVFLGYFRTPEAQRNWPAIHAAIDRSAHHFMLLDRILANTDFLGGNTLNLADITLGTVLYRYFELDITRPALPRVTAWYERLQARPAYREHVMISLQEMRA